MSIESKAAAVKNLALGVGVLVALGAVVYLVMKLKDGIDEGKEKIQDGVEFLLGTSNEATLGTWLYDMIGSPEPSLDESQAIKTCNILWQQNGELRSPVCQKLRAEGKLTPPSPS